MQVDIPPGNSNQVQIILATNDENTEWNYLVTTDLSILEDDDDFDPNDPNDPNEPQERNPDEEKRNEEDGCEDCKGTAPGTSEVELHSGAVLETHELVPYQSLGTNRGLVLTYDSMRADPNKIVYFGFDNVAPDSDTRLIAELEVNGANFNFQLPGYQEKWKHESGYHRRSLSVCEAFRRKTTMFRFKVLFGGKLRRRSFDNQAVELFIQCAILNRMIQNGKPKSYQVDI